MSGFAMRVSPKRNPDYDAFEITPKMDFAVFGKVLTVWRSEQV